MSHVTDAKEPPEGFLSSSAPTLKGLELQEEETVTFAPSLWACLTVGGKPLARLRRVCICGRGVTPQSTLPPCEVVRGVLSCPLQAFPDITVMLATVSLELSAVISQKEKQMERPRGDVSVSLTGKRPFWKLALLVPQTPDPAGSVSSHLVARDVNQTDLFSLLILALATFIYGFLYQQSGFPGGSAGKESACTAGDLGSIPGSGRSPGGRNGNLPQYSCLENPADPGAWRAAAHGSTKSRTQLSD